MSAKTIRPYSSIPFSLIMGVAFIYILILSFHFISNLILSFILILLITLAINPVILVLRRLKGGRRSATAIVVSMFLTILILTLFMFYRPISHSWRLFFNQLPKYLEHLQRPLIEMERKAALSQEKVQKEVNHELGRDGSDVNTGNSMQETSGGILRSSLGPILAAITDSFKTVIANAASLLFVAGTVFFGVIFMSLNPRPFIGALFSLIPEQYHAKTLIISQRIAIFVPQWALATVLGMFAIGILVFLAMIPIFGFQDALVLGLIATILESIPYLGAFVSGLPALLLAVGIGGWTPLIVVGCYITIQLLEHNLIAPVIISGRLQMHPVFVIFSVLICVTIFGILGVLIAVPMAGIIRILHEEIYRKYFLPHVSDRELDRMARIALEAARFSDDQYLEAHR
jgi:predicted PurR-regulated permease PerM